MTQHFNVTIQGAVQGTFKGQGAGRDKDKIPGVALTYGLLVPKDPASGFRTGKRQHNPVVFTKEWGAASPQLFQAAATNEVLKSVLFEFITTNTYGKEEVDYTIELTMLRSQGLKGHCTSARKQGRSLTLANWR